MKSVVVGLLPLKPGETTTATAGGGGGMTRGGGGVVGGGGEGMRGRRRREKRRGYFVRFVNGNLTGVLQRDEVSALNASAVVVVVRMMQIAVDASFEVKIR